MTLSNNILGKQRFQNISFKTTTLLRQGLCFRQPTASSSTQEFLKLTLKDLELCGDASYNPVWSNLFLKSF